MRLLAVVSSCSFLAIFVGGKFISLGLMVCVVLALDYTLGAPDDTAPPMPPWRAPFVAWVGVGALGLILSRFGAAALTKGATQIVGIGIVLLAGSAIVRMLLREPPELAQLMRRATWICAALGAIAIYQFVVSNVLRMPELARFTFLNSISGDGVWRDPDQLGPLFRANSFCREPAHFCVYMGIGSGIAALRLGVLGAPYRVALEPVLGIRTAYLIIGGLVVSLSILGLLQLALVVGLAWIVSRRVSFAALGAIVQRFAIAAVILFVVIGGAFSTIYTKLDTLRLVSGTDLAEAAHESMTAEDALSFSSLTLAVQVTVVSTHLPENPILGIGFGAHPLAYAELVPPWVEDIEGLWQVNADDAASLLLRLVSETGILGTLIYLYAVGAVFWRARLAIVEHTSQPGFVADELTAVAIGVVVSMGSVTIACLVRFAAYYEPMVWLLIAATAAVPAMLRGARGTPSALPRTSALP